MSEIQRYGIAGDGVEDLFKHPAGLLVMYADHGAELARVEAERDAANERFDKQFALLSHAQDQWNEWMDKANDARQQLADAEQRVKELEAALRDPATVHTNILRGGIALTKAQAIHIAGLPADIEQRVSVLEKALDDLARMLYDDNADLADIETTKRNSIARATAAIAAQQGKEPSNG